MPKFRAPSGLLSLVVVSLLAAAYWSASTWAQQGAAPSSPGGAQAAQPDRQFPPLTFKVEVNYVEVDAIVTDQQGRFIGDLTQDDFQVVEDGKPQTLVNFGVVNVPIEYAEAPLFVSQPIEPDVKTNVRPFDGRIYLIVLDDLHIGAQWTPRVRTSAKRLIQAMGANDIAAVVTTGGTTEGSQEFTSSKRLLSAAVDKFMGKGLRSATLNKLDDYNNKRGLPGAAAPTDIDQHQRAYNARNTLESLRNLSQFMAGVHGRRKALVFFSEGIDYDIVDVFNNQYANDVRADTQEAIAAATRSNVSIYSVDPRGLTDVDTIEMSAVDPALDPSLRLDASGMRDELRNQQDSLRVLSEETGGFAAINSNDYSSAFNRMRDENSKYYLLGYYPTNDRRDGRFRKIEVRVNRPGVQVRARKGYVAPRGKPAAAPPAPAGKDKPSPLLRDAMDSPLPLSGLPLAVSAAAFKGTAPNASVAVMLKADGSRLKFTERDGRYDDTLEVSIVAVDQNGKIRNATRQKVDMPLKPQSRPIVEKAGVRVVSKIEIPPGRYQLRIGALDGGSQLAGSVYYDLEVPDFTSGSLSMSGVVLTSTLAGIGPAVGLTADDALRRMLPGPPTLAREFRQDEELALMAEVYDNEGKTPHKVNIATTIRSDDGREVFRIADERSSSEFQGARGGYGYTARVPLKGLAPGLYVLKVEARSTLGKNTTAARELQIKVVG